MSQPSITYTSLSDREDMPKVAKDTANDRGTPMKLATAMQSQFPRKIADFKQETGFQISR
jgi:hypothetical protein